MMNKDEAFCNPIIEQRADPWVYKHTDGFYYFTASVPEYDRIELRRARTIQGLSEAEPIVVWIQHESGIMSANIWAPEIHYIDGSWYIYFAAARKDEIFAHRMYVIKNESDNPLEGIWDEKGQIKTGWESFSLDGTTFEHRGIRYYVWAQNDSSVEKGTNLYIAKMRNPWTIEGPQVMISKPEFEWEKVGFWVNEGAAALKRNGKIFITYSASATDANYCMGLLQCDENSDLLNPRLWFKYEFPVFQTNEATQIFGPGHNSFTLSEDGKQDILIYHARSYRDIVGNSLWDPNRHTHAKDFTWNEDGTPNFFDIY
jgi:GH43 family beta-xylosidase